MKLGVEAALVDGGLVRSGVEILDGRIARVGAPSAGGRGLADGLEIDSVFVGGRLASSPEAPDGRTRLSRP